MLSPSQPHQTLLSELLLRSLYLQELNESLCAKVFSALKILTEGKGGGKKIHRRESQLSKTSPLILSYFLLAPYPNTLS